TLGGELNGRALDGALHGRYTDGTLAIERAVLRVDEGSAEAAGTIGRDAVQLQSSADPPDVDAWYPPASGSVTASGEASGPADNPTVRATLDARELALDAIAPRLDTLRVMLDGTLAAHTIDVRSGTAFG